MTIASSPRSSSSFNPTFPMLLLFAAACLGHLVLMVASHNWFYGLPLPHWVTDAIHLLHGLLVLAFPPLLWWTAAGICRPVRLRHGRRHRAVGLRRPLLDRGVRGAAAGHRPACCSGRSRAGAEKCNPRSSMSSNNSAALRPASARSVSSRAAVE